MGTLLRIKLSEPDFIKITIEPNILKENYNVVNLNYVSDNNYYGYQQQCCYLY